WMPVRLSLAGSRPGATAVAATVAALTVTVSATTPASSHPVLARVRSLVHSACSAVYPARLRGALRRPFGSITRPADAAGTRLRPARPPPRDTAPRNRPTGRAGRSHL